MEWLVVRLVRGRERLPVGPQERGLLKYFRTVESKRSTSDESFDYCLLPHETTSGT